MRVTYLLRCLSMMRGGGETQHLAWMRWLARRGVEIEVMTGCPLIRPPVHAPEPDLETVTLRSPYVRDLVYRLQARRGFGRLTAWALHADEEWFCRLAFRRLARARPRPDLVLAHALYQAPRVARGAVPVAVFLPGAPHRRYIGDLRRADALIADGWAARELPALVGRPVEAVVKGVDADLFTPDGPDHRAALGLGGRPVVVAVARLVPIKNVPLLVEALAIVRRRLPDATLIVVGDGPERGALEARVRALGLGGAVHLPGAVPQEATPAWYRTGDVFALSSDFDNSPNVVLEAMACGRPVIATDVGGLRDYVASPASGRLTPRGDAAALAGALAHYLEHPDEARAAGRRNRAEAVARFSWDASAARLHEVFARAIDRFTRRRGAGAVARAS